MTHMRLDHILLLSTLVAATVTAQSPEPLAAHVTAHYVEQARERYVDARRAAEHLLEHVRAFLDEPSEETHAAAKKAWLAAHIAYSHTEVFRFGNPNVDAWEGKVNAWPMDEGLIDYVAPGYIFHEGNPHALDDIIGKGRMPITDEVIAEYQSGQDPKAAPIATATISDIETNVTTGYHAVEFLLWGQDLNAQPTDCGKRPFTDYVLGDGGTNGHCQRRRDYLSAATRQIIADLRFIERDWDPTHQLYARRFAALPVTEQLDRMVVGMGTLCFAEIASERMQVALISSDQEEEQDCFSDTTHYSILHNALCIETLYLGRHERVDGTTLRGPSLAELTRRVAPDLDQQLRAHFAMTRKLAGAIVEAAGRGEPFDRQIQPENAEGRARVRALIAQLQKQTETLEALRKLIPQLAAR